jgi:putative transposase
MGRPLSKDLRERIVKAVESGTSRNAAAKRFAVSVSAVIKLMQRWHRTGSVEPGQMGGWKDYALARHEDLVRTLIKASPDITLEELGAALGRKGISVGRSSIGRFLIARKLTLKKSRFMPLSRAGQT